MMEALRILVLSVMAAGALAGQALPMMPWPASVTMTPGGLQLSPAFTISVAGAGASDPRVTAAARRTLVRLARQTGLPIAARSVAAIDRPTLRIIIERRDHSAPQRLGDDERYTLRVSSGGARITADGPLGALRGIETFLQLVQQDRSPAAPGFSVPFVDIRDEPRFAWRGLSLDVSRHFIPVEGIKRTIDGLAAVKLNVFHWHLSDDQGFRVESRKYPRLHEYGSEGSYYTQADVKDVVAYARERGVRVVPEFDLPGHAASWLPGYPGLGTGLGPFNIAREYGDPSGVFDPTKEATYRFLEGLIGEMVKLFPDEYFHIGGDEVSAKVWNGNPQVREFMKSHKIGNAAELQAYFNKRLLKILAHHKKRMAGWDEIRQPGLPTNILIQSWRGEKSLAEGARQGYAGILSAGYYLDLMQPAAQHYAVDPLHGEAAGLTPEQKKLILGGEAAMWEELATAENLDSRLWPRMAAIAERFWSPESVTDVASMYDRLERVNRWLEWLGLQQRTNLELMLRRLADSSATEQLQVFAAVLEPVKGYERHRNRYGASSSFNRLVDAIPPESDRAREFREAVDHYLAAPDAAGAEAMRNRLEAWAKNAVEIRPLLVTNSLLTENLPLADALVTLCRTGQDALVYAAGGAPADWKQRTAASFKEATAHHAALLIAIAPGIQKLVDAVR
jgi:hexosaminidase